MTEFATLPRIPGINHYDITQFGMHIDQLHVAYPSTRAEIAVSYGGLLATYAHGPLATEGISREDATQQLGEELLKHCREGDTDSRLAELVTKGFTETLEELSNV